MGASEPRHAVARTAVLLPFPGERGGAGLWGALLGSTSVLASTTLFRPLRPGVDRVGAKRPMGRLERPDDGHDDPPMSWAA